MASVASSDDVQPGAAASTSTASPGGDVPALETRHRGLLMIAVMGASVMQFLDATIANVAIPHMQTSLGATFESVTWVLTSFIIASAVATPLTGWLSDRIGSRRFFLMAVAGFLVASMLCGAAQNLGQMVAFRIIQGIFAAFIGPVSQTIMLDINPPSRHAKAMSIWGMGVMIAPIMGPMIGGWLTENYNWRWVFYINIPIGLPTLAVLWWLLPGRKIRIRPLDYWGFALFALGLGALQLMLDRGQHQDWFESWEIWIELGVCIAALWMFAVHTVTAKHPLFDRAMLFNRNFATALVFMVVMGVVMIALSALLPPMFQNIYGYSVLDTGILLAPRGIGVLMAMVIVGRLVGRVDGRILIGVGYAIAAFSLWIMTGWSLEIGAKQIVIAGLIQGMGMGLTFMPMNMIAFSSLTLAHRTDGASLMNLMRSVGASMGISLITTMLARNIQTSHADMAAKVTPYNIPTMDLSRADRLGEYGEAALRMLDLEINRQAAMIAYLDDFWMMMWVVLIFVPMVIFLRPAPTTNGAPPPME